MPTSNAKIIEQSFKAYIAKFMTKVEDQLCVLIQDAFQYVDAEREFNQFTGNAVASLQAVIYRDGEPSIFIDSRGITTAENPLRKKVQYGEHAWLDNPVEGEPRGVAGSTDEEDEYGIDTALRNINAHRSVAPKKGVAALVSYGARYVTFELGTAMMIAKEDLVRQIRSIMI